MMVATTHKSKLLTIVPPSGPSGVKSGMGTRFLLADGSELTHVARCVVTFCPDEILQATIDVAIDPKDNIEAHPMLSFAAVKMAALHYGFDLVRLPGCSQAELTILRAEFEVVRRERDYLREQLAFAQSTCFATER